MNPRLNRSNCLFLIISIPSNHPLPMSVRRHFEGFNPVDRQAGIAGA
jgi:hypothetical protein